MNARSGQFFMEMAPKGPMDAQMVPFSPDDSLALRNAFGRFSTGVTIVTTQSERGPLGMTANSFSSVSLDPPLVLWSPAVKSLRHDAFTHAEHFCIHVLAAEQFDLAHYFARNGEGFEDIAWTEGPQGAPELTGALAIFHCKRFAVHPAGDHSIVIGRITHASERRGDGVGLLFDQGRFGIFSPSE